MISFNSPDREAGTPPGRFVSVRFNAGRANRGEKVSPIRQFFDRRLVIKFANCPGRHCGGPVGSDVLDDVPLMVQRGPQQQRRHAARRPPRIDRPMYCQYRWFGLFQESRPRRMDGPSLRASIVLFNAHWPEEDAVAASLILNS